VIPAGHDLTDGLIGFDPRCLAAAADALREYTNHAVYLYTGHESNVRVFGTPGGLSVKVLSGCTAVGYEALFLTTTAPRVLCSTCPRRGACALAIEGGNVDN